MQFKNKDEIKMFVRFLKERGQHRLLKRFLESLPHQGQTKNINIFDHIWEIMRENNNNVNLMALGFPSHLLYEFDTFRKHHTNLYSTYKKIKELNGKMLYNGSTIIKIINVSNYESWFTMNKDMKKTTCFNEDAFSIRVKIINSDKLVSCNPAIESMISITSLDTLIGRVRVKDVLKSFKVIEGEEVDEAIAKIKLVALEEIEAQHKTIIDDFLSEKSEKQDNIETIEKMPKFWHYKIASNDYGFYNISIDSYKPYITKYTTY